MLVSCRILCKQLRQLNNLAVLYVLGDRSMTESQFVDINLSNNTISMDLDTTIAPSAPSAFASPIVSRQFSTMTQVRGLRATNNTVQYYNTTVIPTSYLAGTRDVGGGAVTFSGAVKMTESIFENNSYIRLEVNMPSNNFSHVFFCSSFSVR